MTPKKIRLELRNSSFYSPLGLQSLRPVHSVRETLAVIERERNLADRRGSRFALVVFECGDRKSRQRLVRVLAGLARTTDEIGHLRDDCVGAILPDTARQGADIFVDRIVDAARDAGTQQTNQVFIYPNDWNDGSSDSGPGQSERPERRQPSPVTRESAFLNVAFNATQPPAPAAARGGKSLDVSDLFTRRTPLWKRLVDIVVAAFAMLVAAPLFALIALAIKTTSDGPIFFAQNRTGAGGRIFKMYKFRTMVVGAEKIKDTLAHLNEQDGPAFKIKNDPRVTPLGRFLRSSSLDELPQLLNVLKGDMTLVGPRPLPCDETDSCEQWHRRRLDVVPGLTCIWQVTGRSTVAFDEWVRMDVQYMLRRSPWQDMKILLQTVPAVLLRRGAR